MPVRLFQDEDETELLGLLQECFGASYVPELWRWKYRAAPGGFLPPALAEEGGRILGHFGLVLLPVDVQGESLLGALPADVAVAPRAREHSLDQGGALREMRALAYEQAAGTVDFAFAIPIPRFYAVARRLFREQPLRAVPELCGTLTLLPALLQRRVPAARLCAWLGRPLRWHRYRPPRPRGEVSSLSEQDLGEEFDLFWRRCAGGRAVSLRKDSAWLRWRYLQHPLHENRVLVCRQQGELAGFLAFCLHRDGAIRHADILDFECCPETSGAAAALFRAFLRAARHGGADAVRTWCDEQHPLRPFLDGLGLRPEGTIRTLYSPLPRGRAHDETLSRGENWLFAMGDSDGR